MDRDALVEYIETELALKGNLDEMSMDVFIEIVDDVFANYRPEQVKIPDAMGELSRQFATGHRCAVCGMTSKQAEAVGYDCTGEC